MYPGFSNGSIFIKALSDFWGVLFEQKDILKKFMDGYGESFAQAYFSFLEAVLGNTIKEIPVFHKKKWFLLTLKESENIEQQTLKYNITSIKYGPQPAGTDYPEKKVFKYGDIAIVDRWVWELPEPMVNCSRYLMNRIHSPSLVLTKDIDFVISDKKITFSIDPFNNNLISIRNIISTKGEIIDKELGIWVLNSDWDEQYVWKNYGSLIGFYSESSEQYKTFVEAIWKLFAGGPTYSNLVGGINAVLGLPITRDNEELVLIDYTDTENIIVTDKNIYRFSKNIPIRSDFFSSTGKLIKGKTLRIFEPLAEAVNIKDHKSNPYWWRDIEPFIIPWNLAGLNKDMYLPNKEITGINIIGEEWGLEDKDAQDIDFLKKIGLRIGGFLIGAKNGKPRIWSYNVRDYIMLNFFSNNVFLLEIEKNVINELELSKQIIAIIKEAIPAYTTFINFTPLDSFEEEYDLEVSMAEDLAKGPGVELSEEIQNLTDLTTIIANPNNTSINGFVLAGDYSNTLINNKYILEVIVEGKPGVSEFSIIDSNGEIPVDFTFKTELGKYIYTIGSSGVKLAISDPFNSIFLLGDSWEIMGAYFNYTEKLGIDEGYFSKPYIGLTTIGKFVINERAFHKGLLVFSKCVK